MLRQKNVDPRIAKIDHWIVIYQENWSFDGLYGMSQCRRAEQCRPDRAASGPLRPAAGDTSRIVNRSQCYRWAAGGSVDLAQYVDIAASTRDLVHRFYTEQLQIDNGVVEPSNGAMDKFVAWTDNPALVMSYYDTQSLPEGRAQQYPLCDHFFHSAFGGSFLNHQHFVAAQPPRWIQPLPRAKLSNRPSRRGPAARRLTTVA